MPFLGFAPPRGTNGRPSSLYVHKEAAMDNAPGTLAKFHLGLAADGTSCALVFVDEHDHSIACIASFADLNGFIVSLTRAAAEMAQRRAMLAPPDQEAALESLETLHNARPGVTVGAIDVASSDFRMCDDDGTILGSLVGEGGQVVGIRLRPDVANEMTRNMLRTARVASAC
jgi:hypothetical protein